MHTAGQGLLVLGCVAAGLRLRPSRALLLLALVVVVLPAATRLPNGLTPLPTATRLTALAVAVSLLRRYGTAPFRSTPLHLAAGCWAAVTLVTGVLLAGPELPTGRTVTSWLDLLDPLLVGAVGLACVRVAGPRPAVRALAVAALVLVVLGTVEHVTGTSLANRLVGSGPLETRAGQTRVRVGSDFALALGWTLAALAPAVVTQLRRALPLALLGLLGCLAVSYWTFSRTAPLGFAVGLGVLLLGLRDRRAAAVVLAVALGVGAVAVTTPRVRERFSSSVDQGAIDVRTQRAPVVLDAASRHPVAGLGLSGVKALGVPETDDSFLLAYAETGVLGLVTLLVLLAAGAVLVGRGLRGPPSAGRAAAAACLAGALVLVAGGLVFDAFAVRGTAALLGLLLGTGLAAAERVAGPAPVVDLRRDVPHLRVAAVGAAVLAGMAVSTLWPTHVAVSAPFATLTAADESPSYDEVSLGERLVATACAVARDLRRPGLEVRCTDSHTAAGVGLLRLEAARREDLTTGLYALAGAVRSRTVVRHFTATPLLPVRLGTPTLAATAPVSAGLVVLLLGLLVPLEPLRRLQARTRSWAWTVDRRDLLPGPERAGSPAPRVGEQGLQRTREPGQAGDVQGVRRDPLRA